MLKNYLKVTLRTLRKQPVYTAINVVGLGVGIAACLLIGLYVHDELSYDEYHVRKDRIYRLVREDIAKVPGPWGPAIQRDFPAVRQIVRLQFFDDALVRRGEKRFVESDGLYADSTLFDVFSYAFLRGDPRTALVRPHTMVLTKSMAQRYFGTENPLGQTLAVDGETFEVTGVIENVPRTSHFRFSFLVAQATDTSSRQEDWAFNQFYTYVLLDEEATPHALEARLPAWLSEHVDEEAPDELQVALQPLTDIHLHSHLFREMQPNGDATAVYVLAAIAGFVLLIACINFVNLATARSAQRTREVGIRKAVGAQRRQLVVQFLTEAMLLSVAALGMALILVMLGWPGFRAVVGPALSLDVLTSGPAIAVLVGLALGVGVLAGGYPAWVLSAYRPSGMLKAGHAGSGHRSLRKGLIVFQFAVSSVLMGAAGVVYHQVRYMQTKDLGFDAERLVIVPLQGEAVQRGYETLKSELLQHPNIANVSISGNLPGGGDWGIPYVPEGVPEDDIPPMRTLVVDHNFVETFGLEIVAGRDFSEAYATDATGAFLINETAAQQLGWAEPVGRTIAMPAIGRERAPVIGVVKDFHFRSMHEEIGPILLFIAPPEWVRFATLRIGPGDPKRTLAYVEATWSAFDTQYPFTYSFVDERFGALHETEQQIGRLVGAFAGLAIFIACLGLFGLAAFVAQRRTKEIGIRKVLGASVIQIVGLLLREFAVLVGIALAFGLPVAYTLMNRWLDDFAYRIDIGPGLLGVTGGLALLIAGIAVSYHILCAATVDPAETLRTE